MKIFIYSFFWVPSAFSAISPLSHEHAFKDSNIVLIETAKAKALGGMILAQDEATHMAVANLDRTQVTRLVQYNHSTGKCGGFEALSPEESQNPAEVLRSFAQNQNRMSSYQLRRYESIGFNQSYDDLAQLADPQALQKNIQWFSSYPNRFNKAADPNRHVEDLYAFLAKELQGSPWNYSIEKIEHKSTRQNTLKVAIQGRLHPEEVVVIGAHFDSINSSFFGGSGNAPGADDNASGSSNILEALKILKNWNSFDRSLEFYWYAGEESGLLGSAEIAAAAKRAQRKIVGVLQLDMTLFPGNGENIVGLLTDFTSPWLGDLLQQINSLYVKAKMVPDVCGYGCSDHASWHRQGFHAITPFEATSKTMNRNIHTDRDILNSQSSLQHSNNFTKYALLFALVLGNSDLKP